MSDKLVKASDCKCCECEEQGGKMTKRMNTEEFIRRARIIHCDKYDYSETNFLSTKKMVKIICPVHGEFIQLANNHLHGNGCPKCARNNVPRHDLRKLVFGFGINDSEDALSKGKTRKDVEYYRWHGMLQRCYDNKFIEKHDTYRGCSVCEKWKYFTAFRDWFRNPCNGYIDGYNLDKDILVKGNKIYSPDTCCFVPPEINILFTKTNKLRGDLPIGVQHYGDKYKVLLQYNGYPKYLGLFSSVEEAFSAYKKAKEDYIKEKADYYFKQGLITEKVYNALYNYKVEITD